MRKQISILLFFLLPAGAIYAQTSNGTVSSLVAAENYFAGIAKEKGVKKAFLTVSDENTIVFRPNPVKAEKYFGKQDGDDSQLSWHPTLAKISKSGDWGFTTGPYIFKTSLEDEKTTYGQYLSVWKMNSKGVWKLAIDLGIPHDKPKTEEKLHFTDPKNTRFFNQRSVKRLQQREEMILTSDELFSATLKNYKNLAYNVFLGDDARLLFPGYEPIIGKTNITDFLRNQELQIATEPVEADRALGSDLAYTYGTATIAYKGKESKYNYVRIWEVQDGHKWNVTVEVFSPAGE
ncbi:hypothetical protein [Daejeonella oryzae]|uniref:hypothetical protein n=1 Tax=Daejeonella oryzae TaxID=1122943 RepID=UPI00041BB172|nr:hypothetical protein [Daejeonella oryzae]